MAQELILTDILSLRPNWPGSALALKHPILDANTGDLRKTIERMESSRGYYRRELAGASAFQTRHDVDYSDSMDRFDANARKVREWNLAISYLQKLARTAAGCSIVVL